MCAIYGSGDISLFIILHQVNKHRGVFASSLCSLNTSKPPKEILVIKTDKDVDYEKNIKIFDKRYNYHVGHVQAPTSKKQTWDEETAHPFETEDWLVSHNGVLTNYIELNKKYCEWNDNPVDTAVIVNMLQNETYKSKKYNEIKVIEKVCSSLEGTFACYIINKEKSTVYLVRQGSTLFYKDGYFSSVQGLNMLPVPDGSILKLDEGIFKEVGKFKCTTPFLTL